MLNRGRPFAELPDWRYLTPPGAGAPSAGGGGITPEQAQAIATLAPSDQVLATLAAEQVALLTEVRDLLQALVQDARERTPEGAVLPWTQPVTTLDPVRIEFTPPLFILGLTNDGAGIVQYKIPNRSQNWIDLRPNEVQVITLPKGKIADIGLRVQGVAGTIRMFGVY